MEIGVQTKGIYPERNAADRVADRFLEKLEMPDLRILILILMLSYLIQMSMRAE